MEQRRPDHMLRLQLLRDIATARDNIVGAAKVWRAQQAKGKGTMEVWQAYDEVLCKAVDLLMVMEEERDKGEDKK
jgi:hypothetical protein